MQGYIHFNIYCPLKSNLLVFIYGGKQRCGVQVCNSLKHVVVTHVSQDGVSRETVTDSPNGLITFVSRFH